MSSTVSVIVNITDVNDLPPVFDTITSPLILPEDMSPEVIATVIASDGDSGTNAEVRLLIQLYIQHFNVFLDTELEIGQSYVSRKLVCYILKEVIPVIHPCSRLWRLEITCHY